MFSGKKLCYIMKPDLRKKACRTIVILFLLILAAVYPSPSYSSGYDVWCTSPWIALIADFIGGIHISVHSIESWEENGARVRLITNEQIPNDSLVVALDRVQADTLGINRNYFPNLKTLYSRIPVISTKIRSLYYDPSTLPFIAQGIMNVLSDYDPVHYSYFQRRLAEFQTRLDSTVLVGRKLLKGARVILAGEDVSQLLKAAGCSIEPLSADLIPLLPEETKDKKKNKKMNEEFDKKMKKLVSILQKQRKKGNITLVDSWTPLYLREKLLENEVAIMLPEPSLQVEFILFLNDHYLALWNELRLLNN